MAKEKMKNYDGRIETNIIELEEVYNQKDRIRIIEYGDKISRVNEVNKNTGHIYRNLCCRTEWDVKNEDDRHMIRKKMIGVRGIRKKSL